MKKSLFFGMLVAMILLATSCQHDEVLIDNNNSVVTFEISTPEIATRATFSDGTTATQLQYAVYDDKYNLIDREGLKGTAQLANKKANIQMKLAAGKTYNVLFWAAAPNAPYTIDFKNLVMNVNYDAAVSNDENRDAFYCFKNVPVKQGNEAIKITLTRPFAQLNIGTDDLTIAQNDGINVSMTQVVVPVYSTLDFKTGVATGKAKAQTFAFANLPDDSQTFPAGDYDYLAMNYLLVGADKTVVDVEFAYGTTASHQTRSFTSIPVRPNYRTNIYGSLLTQGIDFIVEIDNRYATDPENPYNNNYNSYAISSKAEAQKALETAKAKNENYVVLEASDQYIGDFNYALTTELVPSETTVIIKNANITGRSYGNKTNGKVVFENCTFNNETGAYSIHFDGGVGEIVFKDCVLYGWNSFGPTLSSVSFYDSRLYGNGMYAMIRSYVELYMENCYINTVDAIHDDEYTEGVEEVDGEAECNNCYFSEDTDKFVEDMLAQGPITIDMDKDLAVTSNSYIHSVGLTEDLVINGNGHTIVSFAESANNFDWKDGIFAYMSTTLTSQNGSSVTVNDLNFTGPMTAITLGNYNGYYNPGTGKYSKEYGFNTTLNNVNIINAEVFAYAAGIAPALAIYGNATLNNCHIYGTTLSELDTQHKWPVYDVGIPNSINGSSVTINGGKYGSIYVWEQPIVTINGAEVETIVARSDMYFKDKCVTIKAGTKVGSIDLSAIIKRDKISFKIEDGAIVGKIVDKGHEYATLEEWQSAQ